MLNGKRVLIANCCGLGDLIMFTPAVRAIKAQYPDVFITIMTSDRNEGILDSVDYIDKIIYIRRKKFLGRLRCAGDILRQDYIVFTDWQPQSLMLAGLFHKQYVAGVPREGHKLTKYLTKHITKDIFQTDEYAARTNIAILADALGINISTRDCNKIDVAGLDEKAAAAVQQLLSGCGITAGQKYMLLNPFAALEQRCWNINYAKEFIQQAEQLFAMPVIVIGGKDKAAEALTISQHSLAGKTSIRELIELIRQAELLITPDSGPMHIAGAVGTRVVPLFSKDLPSRWAPKTNCWPITLNMPCSPCNDETARACKHVKCMNGITSAMVLEVCKKAYFEGAVQK